MKKAVLFFGTLAFSAILFAACNNGSEKKFPPGEVIDDSTEIIVDDAQDSAAPVDTGIDVVTI